MPAQFKVTTEAPDLAKLLTRPFAGAAVKALAQTADDIVEEGRRNIATAGRFGANWQRDLQARMKDTREAGEPSLKAKAFVFHKSALAGIFEYGATIAGKPLLWIPTTPGAPPIKRSGKRLTFAIVRGTHLAFDADDRDRHRRPLYFGVPVAHIAKKWRITEIANERVEKIGELFNRFFQG
jgi:uncharacterized protein DUF6441